MYSLHKARNLLNRALSIVIHYDREQWGLTRYPPPISAARGAIRVTRIISKSRATSFRQTILRIQSVGDHAEQAAQPARASRGLRRHGQPLVVIVRGSAHVTDCGVISRAQQMATKPKGDRPLCSTAIRYAHRCRRRRQPIQGIPISSRELGVARSVFDAQWFVKQALQ